MPLCSLVVDVAVGIVVEGCFGAAFMDDVGKAVERVVLPAVGDDVVRQCGGYIFFFQSREEGVSSHDRRHAGFDQRFVKSDVLCIQLFAGQIDQRQTLMSVRDGSASFSKTPTLIGFRT